MGKKDKRIDAYIAKSESFAQPILKHIRNLVHEACPEVEETMKWSFPHFDYYGIMCAMAAFRQHCSFGFWKASLMKDPHLVEMAKSEQGMGHLGQLKSLKDLPPDKQLLAYIREAAELNKQGIKVKRKPKPAAPKELKVPSYFAKALKGNKKAWAHFENFSYSKKKDYVEWLEEAKTEETQKRRLETAIEWIGEGKARNWKYER